jgi:hypothetical protein
LLLLLLFLPAYNQCQLPSDSCGLTEAGLLLISSGHVSEMAARPYSGSVSTLMPLMVNHTSPHSTSLSSHSCALPKHWQISGLDGATATCHRGGDTIVFDNAELQDPEHQ